MSIQQFEEQLRFSEDSHPYRRLMSASLVQMGLDGPADDPATPQHDGSGWWPWLDNGGE